MTTNTYNQTPAEGILLHKDFGSSKFYRVPCDCGNGDDEISFDVEADDSGVTAHHYVKVKSNWWSDQGIFGGLLTRLKITWTLWTKGYVEYEAWTMMTKQQTINYAHTLLSAAEDVEKFRKDQNEQSN